MSLISILGYFGWVIFTFMAVVWLLVLLENRKKMKTTNVPKILPLVSIIIPAYNEEDTIKESIESALNIDYPKNLLDIILINDCSTDNTKKIGESFLERGLIRMVNNNKNMGKAYSLNRTIDMAKGDLIACLDADSLVSPDALKKMISVLENPKIGAVTPAFKVRKTNNILEKLQFAEYSLNVFLRKIMGAMDSIHVTPGVFSLYRKSILKEVGGFEVGNLTEDMDMALKIHTAGYSIDSTTDAICYTYCPSKLKPLFKQRIRWYRGTIKNSIKHKHMFFNRKYGNIGLFFMPFNFISIIAVIILLASWGICYLLNFSKLIWQLSLVNWSFDAIFQYFALEKLLFMFIYNLPVLPIMGLIIGSYTLYKSFNITGEKISDHKPGYFIYLLVFPLFLTLFWSAALIYEIAGVKNRWY
ncbi:MAG: glycosyltransferase [Nanoarchaeota archaeon]